MGPTVPLLHHNMSSEFIGSEEEVSHASCASFWGPYRPFFGGHSLREAATSTFFSTIYVLIWRAAFALVMSLTLIVYIVKGDYTFQFYSIWCHLGISIAFIASSIASAFYLFSKPPRSNNVSFLAHFAVLSFQVFATAALFLDIVFWAILFDFDTSPNFATQAQHAYNLLFVLLDIVLCARMQFKLIYGAVFIVYTIAFLSFAWIRFAITDDWVYNFLDFRNQSTGTTVAYYFGVFAWAVVASVVMILLSRISRSPCIKAHEKSKRADASIDDDAFGAV